MKNMPTVWLATAVLLIMFGLMLTSMQQLGPTFDEQGFITRGLGYLRGNNRHMRVGHPLGLNALNAAFLRNDLTVNLPTEDPSWHETNFHRPSELFLWEIGNNVEHVMFLARLPTLWLGMLLAAIAGRWAWAMTKRKWAGLLALALVAFDPNILAHSQLTTTDLGLAFGATLAGATLWYFLKRPSYQTAVLAGFGFGILQNTKFTSGLFVPLFALVILIALIGKIRDRQTAIAPFLLQLLIIYPLAGFFTLWATNGFQIGQLPAELPTFSEQLGGRTLPLAHHIEQLTDIGGRLQASTPSFLLGQYSDSGWWYYFPVAFLLKTPLPTLALLIWAKVQLFGYLWVRRSRQWSTLAAYSPVARLSLLDLAALLIPAWGYFAIALTSDINLGYRHLLPMLPSLAVFIAAMLQPSPPGIPVAAESGGEEKTAVDKPKLPPFIIHPAFALVAWLLFSTAIVHPHLLTYFNLLAGGPNNGWESLVDSNIDWGQDLHRLRGWMDENGVQRVWLSYFGESRPEYYGITYDGLDSFPPRLMNPNARPFSPYYPAPGIYAISATNLQGVLFANHDQFGWFRQREPIDKLGNSIFLYRVEPVGEPVALTLSGVQLDELAADDVAQFQSNQATSRWFDSSQSLLLPNTNWVWLGLGAEAAIPQPLNDYLADRQATALRRDHYVLFPINPRELLPEWVGAETVEFGQDNGRLSFQGSSINTPSVTGGAVIDLTTAWRNETGPQPVKMFIHVTNANDEIVAQWDGLGATWEGWRIDDTLLQTHHIWVDPAIPPDTYNVWVGLYHPLTFARWQMASGEDRLLLGSVEIEAP
ncbi:MAG: phospholipid carrier-dependent glycosyltransferase [Chloroflexota bacterium]